LLEHIRSPVSEARLRACIGIRLKAEGGLVVVSGLLGISYIKLYIIDSMKRQKILHVASLF
jgi:hypothetical protein